MNNIDINLFKNLGFLSCKFSDEQLFPIRDEIKKIIDSNFTLTQNTSATLAGNIEKEYTLVESANYIEKLMIPFAIEYDKTFNYLKALNVLTEDVPLVLDRAWVNFQKKNEFNPNHNHTGIFSFVIWINIPYDIEDEMNNPSSRNSNYNCAGHFEFTYIGALGDIGTHKIPADKTYNNTALFFPARMVHTVYPFTTTDDFRISVSGNFKLKV